GSDSFPQRIAPTPDGAFMLVALDGASAIAAVSTAALLPLDRIDLPGVHPQGLAVTPDGRLLLATDEGDLVHPGRVARISLDGLGSGGARLEGTAPTAVFPQAVLIVP